MYKHGNRYFVAEGSSLEEAVIKFFNMILSTPSSKTFEVGGITVTECPERMVSTPELREVMYR